MILMIDNYDSFTYNLYQYIGEINPDILVARNDKITIEEIKALSPTHIVISPGPGFPSSAGICVEMIKKFSPTIPILGVCLGHQAIGEAFGAKIVHAPYIMHGKADMVTLDLKTSIFNNMAEEAEVGRYHSLIIDEQSLPSELVPIAKSRDGLIMGVRHREYMTFGIQFHPESVLTPNGKQIISNFLEQGGELA